MDLLTLMETFPDEESCFRYLEYLRWGDTPACVRCGSTHVARKKELKRVGRWNCHDCHISYNALSGTIFQGTRVPMRKWFMAVVILVNAKKSVSSYQLARDIDATQKTAWSMAMRVREAMDTEIELLKGIVEVDETYIGKRDSGDQIKIMGAVERGGNVVAWPVDKVGKAMAFDFLGKVMSPYAELMTDEAPFYKEVGAVFAARHRTVSHSLYQWADGEVSTNQIEGFWAGLKRAFKGTHSWYSKRHAASYVIEACFKYNIRNMDDVFTYLLREAITA